MAVTNNQGPATDVHNNPVADPTSNVTRIVEEAVRRLDDIRHSEFRRIDDLRSAESRRIDEQAAIRADYTERLSNAEAKRIDAIRAVDVNAVAVASQRAADQASVLANQVSQSADTLRAALNTTATTIAAQMESKFGGIIERLAALEKSSYEGQGRSKVADPQTAELIGQVGRLVTSGATSGGMQRGADRSWQVLLGAAGLFLTILTIGSVIFSILK